ncbi:MAG TPA: hypothetical protein VF209_03070 [Patescibacteria group bacterium]
MFTKLHDRIQVIGIFTFKGFIPKKFQWKDKVYLINQVTLVSDVKDGGLRQRWYSVEVRGNVYRLLYNRDHDEWWLEEVYVG